MNNQPQPIKNFLTGLRDAGNELQTLQEQLPITDAKVQDSSLFTLRVWYKDGNARTFHSWKQEIPNPGNTIEELAISKVDHQYAFERLEKFFREGVDKLDRRHFYQARTAIIYENINDAEVLRFVYQKELYRATLHWGTSTAGNRYLSSLVHFDKRGNALPAIIIPHEAVKQHIRNNRNFIRQKFEQDNSKQKGAQQ